MLNRSWACPQSAALEVFAHCGRAFTTRRPAHIPFRAQTCRSIAHAYGLVMKCFFCHNPCASFMDRLLAFSLWLLAIQVRMSRNFTQLLRRCLFIYTVFWAVSNNHKFLCKFHKPLNNFYGPLRKFQEPLYEFYKPLCKFKKPSASFTPVQELRTPLLLLGLDSFCW